MIRPRFHLAFPVHDLGAARRFYGTLLGCREGRSTERWVDFDFHGHQISAHLRPEECNPALCNEVDGKNVPVRHFGLILEWVEWQALAARLRALGVSFVIEPGIRFEGQIGEQATMFLLDPSGNALEFKSFRDERQVFARD
ncbi:MAG: VOC family protein [Nevskiales bacterium]